MAKVAAMTELETHLGSHLAELSGKKPLSAELAEHHLTHIRNHCDRLGRPVGNIVVLGKSCKQFLAADGDPVSAATNYLGAQKSRKNGSTRFHVTAFVATPG